MRSFASDNNSSVHPRIMEALMKANNGHALGYGDDPWTEEAAHKVKEQFSRPCEALFVFNGTGSNTMAVSYTHLDVYKRQMYIWIMLPVKKVSTES